MTRTWLFILFAAASVLVAGAATAPAVTIDDVIVHYKYDDTSGTVFDDSGNNGNDATFYRYLKYSELPPIDASEVTLGLGAPFGSAKMMGTREVGGFNHDVMIDVPASTALPQPGDSFAVSYWLNAPDWGGAYGMIASYKLNGLDWTIGMHSSSTVDGLVVTSGDADEFGTANFTANCATILAPNTFAHFVVQFEGTSGVTKVYIDGGEVANLGSTTTFWGNEKEVFALAGRVLSARNFTSVDAMLDDFAVIPGVVTQTQVNNLRSFGVAGSGVTTSLHYSLDESTGSTMADSSANGLDGTLIGFDHTQERQARGISTAMVPGVHGTAAEFAGGWNEHAKIETPTNMPTLGEACTAMFWLRCNAWNYDLYYDGVVMAQTLDGYAITIGPRTQDDGLCVRTSTSSDPGDTIDMAGIDTTVLTDNEYAHFAIVLDATGNITEMYLNGVPAKDDGMQGLWNNDDGEVTLGARIRGGNLGYSLDCEMDDFAIIDGALTQTQIQLAMNDGVEALYSAVQIPGDTNGDQIVNATDAEAVAANWGSSVTPGDVTAGDFNNDGVVDAKDASIMAANWGDHTEGGAAVPEPGTLALLLGALVGLVFFRRRHS